MLEVHAIFRGEVQGVGFRATTIRVGQELGLTGTVENLRDGTVEVVAQGQEEMLKLFLDRLRASFDVYEVVEEFRPIVKKYSQFTSL